MLLVKCLLTLILAGSLFGVQTDTGDEKHFDSSHQAQRKNFERLQLRFQGLREKKLEATIEQNARQSGGQQKQTYQMVQTCLKDGFRRAVVKWRRPKTQELRVINATSELLRIPNESHIVVSGFAFEGGRQSWERPQYSRDQGQSRVTLPTSTMNLVGLIWDGKRVWDLTDKDIWADASVTEPDRDVAGTSKLPSGNELEIGMKEIANGGFEFSFNT